MCNSINRFATFGERHSYVLQGEGVAFGRTLAAPKRLHVSPFFDMQGGYRFRFMRRDEAEGVRLVSRVELHAPDGSPRLLTSLSGHATPLTQAAVRALLWRAPAAAWAVTLRIHWQALRLWAKRVPWFSRPADPSPSPASTPTPPASHPERISP